MAFKLPGLSRDSNKAASTNVDTILEVGDKPQVGSTLPLLAGRSASEQLRMLRTPFLILAILTAALVLYQVRVSSFGTAYVTAAAHTVISLMRSCGQTFTSREKWSPTRPMLV